MHLRMQQRFDVLLTLSKEIKCCSYKDNFSTEKVTEQLKT